MRVGVRVYFVCVRVFCVLGAVAAANAEIVMQLKWSGTEFLGRSPRTQRARKECGMQNPHRDPGKNIQTFLCVSGRARMCAPICVAAFVTAVTCRPHSVP